MSSATIKAAKGVGIALLNTQCDASGWNCEC
jgi:hypothetical protein